MLYEHQIDGAAWLAARPTGRGYLGDVPGTGKTRTALAALSGVGSLSNALIVCPAIVRTHWAREAALLGYDGLAAGAPIIKSYDEIVRGGVPLMKDLIQNQKIVALEVDEAHFLKSLDSKRSKILLGKNGYARRLAHVFAGSGTPVPKNPSEFWTILSSLFPEVAIEHGLKTFEEFVARFCISRGSYVRGAWREKFLPTVQNPEEFKAILSKVMLRRTLDDVGLDVPMLDWQTVRLDADASGETPIPGHLMASIQQGELDAVANDPHVARMRRRIGELKVKPVVELLNAQLADSDEKICVFAHHRDVLEGLKAGLTLYHPAYIDGDTPQSQRDAEIERFATSPECRVFIGQNIACGTGTDGLQKSSARRMILVEPDWSAYQNVQLGKRLARMGQRSERVVVQMVALAGTLDESIIGQNLSEVRMADSVGLGET